MKRLVLDWVRIAAIGLLIFAAVSGWQGWRLSNHQNELAECQARWNQVFAVAQAERAKAADEDRTALDTLISTVSQAQTAAESRAALAQYQHTRAEADKRRRDNPIPQPPSAACR